MKVNIRKIILLMITLVIMIYGNLMTLYIVHPDDMENKWVFIFVVCIIIIFISIKEKLSIIFNKQLTLSKYKLAIFLIWEFFIFTVFCSKFSHGEFQILEFILYSILVPLVFFSNKIQKYKGVLLISYLISILPFLYLVRSNNPGNNLGIVFCIGGIILLDFMKMKRVNEKFIYLTLILFPVLIFITKSRSALIVSLFIVAIYFFSIIIKNNDSYLIITRKLIIALISFILAISVYNSLINLFFYKWGNNQNLTSGRIEVWLDIFNNGITLFGNGENYFLLTYGLRDAHNNLIQVLGAYGIVSFIFLIIIFIYIIFKSIRLFRLDYICFFGGYILLGQFENLFFINSRLIPIHLIFFMYLGCLINEKRHKTKRCRSNILES